MITKNSPVFRMEKSSFPKIGARLGMESRWKNPGTGCRSRLPGSERRDRMPGRSAEDPGCKNSPEDVSFYIAYDKNSGEDNTDDCEQNGDSDIVKRSCHILRSV